MKDSYRGMWRRGGGNRPERPLILTVVAPSGKRPRSVDTDRGTKEYVEGKPIEVTFSYPVVFVPAGKSACVQARVWDKTPVLLREAQSSELQTACCIHWSQDSEPTEVVFLDDALWWSQPQKLTMPHFVAALSAGDHAAVGLLDPRSVSMMKPAASMEELKARKVVRDGRDGCITNLNRGASQLIVSNGRLFLREGAPLFSLWNGDRNQSITSVGTGEVVIELCSTRRNPAFEDVSNYLIFGILCEASDRTGLENFARDRNATVEEASSITILRPDLLRQDPIKVQVEATLRKLVRLLAIKRAGMDAGREEVMAQRRQLCDVAERPSSALTLGRALKAFLDWTADGRQPWKKKLRVETLFIRDAIDRLDVECARRGEPSPFEIAHLSEEDDAAIDMLSDNI